MIYSCFSWQCVQSDRDVQLAIEVIESLNSPDKRTVILVEGKRDKESLIKLGVKGEIYVINNGKSTVENSEILAERYEKVVILTDWDRTGGRLARAFSEQLNSLGMDFSLEERKKLSFLCKKDVKDIESLYSLLSG